MPVKRPLSFIPDPIPPWRAALPAVVAAMVVLSARYLPGMMPTEDSVRDVEASEQISDADEEAMVDANVETASASEEPEEDTAQAEEEPSTENASEDKTSTDKNAKELDKATKSPRQVRKSKPMSPRALAKAERAAAGLRAALRDGRVVTSTTLFAVVARGERGWDEAEADCRRRSVDGVRGWRLASRQELRVLERAGKLPSGAYWTRNRYPVDDLSAYAYDRGTSKLWLKQEPNGAVVCTQPRPH